MKVTKSKLVNIDSIYKYKQFYIAVGVFNGAAGWSDRRRTIRDVAMRRRRYIVDEDGLEGDFEIRKTGPTKGIDRFMKDLVKELHKLITPKLKDELKKKGYTLKDLDILCHDFALKKQSHHHVHENGLISAFQDIMYIHKGYYFEQRDLKKNIRDVTKSKPFKEGKLSICEHLPQKIDNKRDLLNFYKKFEKNRDLVLGTSIMEQQKFLCLYLDMICPNWVDWTEELYKETTKRRLKDVMGDLLDI